MEYHIIKEERKKFNLLQGWFKYHAFTKKKKRRKVYIKLNKTSLNFHKILKSL